MWEGNRYHKRMKTIPRGRVRQLLAIVLSLTASAQLQARECARVKDAWIRMPPANMPMMAGFGRVVNDCPKPLMIVAVRSQAFASVELHETRTVDGVSRMRAVPELRLPPDGSVLFKPGGLHLMMMRPGAPLKYGSKVVVEFVLADGGRLLGEFEVRKP